MSSGARFFAEVQANVQALGNDSALRGLSNVWMREVGRYHYSYNFSWMGRPIIQMPQDMVAMQEIIWTVQPDLIIETGIAHGGSLVFYASMLELLGNSGRVLGIDIDIRQHNRVEIEKHPMYRRISMIQGSSIDPAVVENARTFAQDCHRVLVVLDSNHTHAHVLRELELYSPLVTKGSYMVVFDTAIEDMPPGSFPDRPWDNGNNPKTAVHEFLRANGRFVIDSDVENKLQITVAPDGYLKCVRD